MLKIMKWIFDRIPQKTKVNSKSLYVPITNIIANLPHHPTKKFSRRTLEQVDTVLVHQAGIAVTRVINYIEKIAKYHITPTEDRDKDGVIEEWERNHLSNTGCPGICYHFIIMPSGKISQINKISSVTWHAKGWNTRSLGILVAGNFTGPHWQGVENPTVAQLRNLKRLLRILMRRYNIKIENIKGHGEINAYKENCPGNIIMACLNEFKK